MVEIGVRSSISMETTCGALLKELEHIWTDIGESEAEKDRMLLELEMECMQVYRRKVEESTKVRAKLHQSLMAKEAEFTALVASLGEHNAYLQKEKRLALRDQLAYVTPLLEDLKVEKDERIKQFADVGSKIEKIEKEIFGYSHQSESLTSSSSVDEHDLSIRKLNEYQAQLRNLQKEKSERLHRVLEYVNEVRSLCGILGEDFVRTVDEVHPSLHDPSPAKSTNISDSTLEGLARTIQKFKTEKKIRTQKLQETAKKLLELWNLMDSSQEERSQFERVVKTLGASNVTQSGILALETIEKTEAEVERLRKLKASRMKELVMKRRMELEEICREAHIEPDTSTAQEKSCAMIDSGLVDPSELVTNIEAQIVKAKEEFRTRKDIMDRINKWQVACAEEMWLEEYNQDDSRYNAGRGSHLNLKRAEKARVTVSKIPAIVETLISRTCAWEDERNMPFLYDGVRLVSILEEYRLTRLQKEEEKRRERDHKKLQNLILTEKELKYGSKPTPKRSTSFNRKANVHYANGNGFMTPSPRRVSVGGGTPELLTPRSCSGRQNSYFRENRRLTIAPLNFVAISKEDTLSTFTSVSGSERSSPPHC
ncbi:uncharacterized protein A4U43_C03F12240 [Asparagus officinalis]|uniref:65-kDa microtubule-associated protein 6 n=1 Tax=Asparagus officinalis TaxID=4686 RepID=A0A5P1FC70_ASPOF|nr:65-kDa microtubule-associated protein 6-like [Asparagus officinalis]ONK74997.1 uncharacterized protein A4U43_C03F12240 [Asparagus officinalis]